jgi:hypothetical protein
MESLSTWQKCFSNKHQTHYWFNSTTGESRWTPPPDDVPPAKRARVETDCISAETISSSDEGKTESHEITANSDIAIIVPFRDIHKEQKRSEHLRRFVPALTSFFGGRSKSFHIYIIEQSNDGRKFNRGKLLNIGFDIARSKQSKVFVFHDVDLIPSSHLLPYYSEIPSPGPVHIARVWDRYSNNPKYFGGIVAFSKQQFEGIRCVCAIF